MTTSQVTSQDGTTAIRFGRRETPVPGPLAVILTELIRAGRPHTGTGSPASTPWLFPGGLPGRPITAAQLGQRLRTLGVYAMADRRAALTDLTAQLPAAVLALLQEKTRPTDEGQRSTGRPLGLSRRRSAAAPRISLPPRPRTGR